MRWSIFVVSASIDLLSKIQFCWAQALICKPTFRQNFGRLHFGRLGDVQTKIDLTSAVEDFAHGGRGKNFSSSQKVSQHPADGDHDGHAEMRQSGQDTTLQRKKKMHPCINTHNHKRYRMNMLRSLENAQLRCACLASSVERTSSWNVKRVVSLEKRNL